MANSNLTPEQAVKLVYRGEPIHPERDEWLRGGLREALSRQARHFASSGDHAHAKMFRDAIQDTDSRLDVTYEEYQDLRRPDGRLRRPQVFLTGYTTTNIQGLLDYLEYTGQADFSQALKEAAAAGVKPAEALVSFYAKLCYKSLVVGENANITQVRDIPGNIKGAQKQAHGSVFEHISLNWVITDCSRVYCFMPDTELLTLGGWKKVQDVTTEDKLLTMDPLSRVASWNHPESTHEFKFDGLLKYWMTTQYTSPMVTPDHILWAAEYDRRAFRGLPNDEIVKQAVKQAGEEMWGRQFVVDHAVQFDSVADSAQIKLGGHVYDTYLLFSWLGWMAANGTFSKDRPNQSTIRQSKLANLPDIRTILNGLFENRWREHGPYNDSTVLFFTISDQAVTNWAKNMIGPNKEEREFSQLFAAKPSRRLLNVFLEHAIRGDGSVHQKNGHEVLYCPNERSAGWWQAVVSMCGKCATVREDDRVGESHEISGVEIRQTKPSYIVSISRKRSSLVKKEHQREQFYKGKVYCPKTEHGLVFARYDNGLPLWSGNTHEQARHRVGVAYSQTSGRYCRIEPGELAIVFDPILEGCEDIIEDVLERIEKAVYLIECRKGLRKPPEEYPDAKPEDCFEENNANGYGSPGVMWVPTGKEDGVDFAYKKKLTSAARRIAPNGQVNEMGMTTNVRVLRHMILLRTARFAEWEIRVIYADIYRLAKAKWPLMFADAQEREVDGLLEVYGMKMNPYDRELSDYEEEQLWGELHRRGVVDSPVPPVLPSQLPMNGLDNHQLLQEMGRRRLIVQDAEGNVKLGEGVDQSFLAAKHQGDQAPQPSMEQLTGGEVVKIQPSPGAEELEHQGGT